MNERQQKSKKDYAHSKEAWAVAAWRYNHAKSKSVEECAKATGLGLDTVRGWWHGVDLLYSESGGAHFHFRGKATADKVGGILGLIVGEQ